MNCNAFREWLDEGCADKNRRTARQHIGQCAECAREFEAARSIDWALGQRFATAPARFADRVMESLPARPGFDPATIPLTSPGRLTLGALLRAGLLNLNVIAASALLLVPWMTGLDNWRKGIEAIPSLGGDLLSAGMSSPAVGLPSLPFLPSSLPLIAIPVAAASIYLLYRLGLTIGGIVSSLTDG